MNNVAFDQSRERGLLLRLEYLKKVFATVFPEYPEPSRESLLRWSVFDTSVVERAMAIIAVRFSKRAPLDIYKTITQEARDQSYVQRRKAKAHVEGGRATEDVVIRRGLAVTELKNDRAEFLQKCILDQKAIDALPPTERQALHNIDDRTSFRHLWANRLGVEIKNADEFYIEDGLLKARAKS
jgi:hypothetical protein